MPRRSLKLREAFFPLLAAVVGILATAAQYRTLADQRLSQIELKFRFNASQRIALLGEAFSGLLEDAEAAGRFFEQSDAVHSEEYVNFLSPWVAGQSFTAIAWAVPSGGAERLDRVVTAVEPRYIVPTLASKLEFAELLDRTEARDAVARAAFNGRTTVSAMMEHPVGSSRAAVLVCRPVFGASDDSGVRRFGVLISLIDLESVAGRLILSTSPLGLPTTIRDADAAPGQPSFSHAPRLGEPLREGRTGGLRYERSLLSMGDRTWEIVIRPSTAYLPGADPSAYYFIATGSIASIALALLLLVLVRGKRSAEDAAAAKGAEFEHFFDMSLDLFAIAGTDGYFKRINAEWGSTLGYPLADLEGARFLDLVHPDDLAKTLEKVSRLAQGEEVVCFVNRYRHENGSYRQIEWRSRIAPDGQTIFAAARDITARIAMEDALRRSIEEKEALLREVHHRVKNNMQVISSLLDLEAMKLDDPRFTEAAREAQGRIRSMAMVHERLYRQESVSAVDMGDYLRELAVHVAQEYGAGAVELIIDAGAVLLDLDTAVPCGLAVNELLTNAYKYACRGRAASISVTAAIGGGLCAILVEDDGPGIPEGALERSRAGATLGLGLVAGLADQLHGDLRILPGRGARIELRFPYRGVAAGAGPRAGGDRQAEPDGVPRLE